MRIALAALVAALVVGGTVAASEAVPVTVTSVTADDETDPVGHRGDAADDPAIWVDHANPSASLVIGNDKKGALEVYDLTGARVQRITSNNNFWGNVDVRQSVTIGNRSLDVVMAYNGGLRPYVVNPATHRLVAVGDGNGTIPTNGGEGLCLYRSSASGALFAFVITRPGQLRQYRIHDADGDGLLQGTEVRAFTIGSEAEGCVADDATGDLYVSQEDVGLWRYGAEPDEGSARTSIDTVQPTGRLAADVEGATIVDTGSGNGYLIVSAQNVAAPNQSYFNVYDRRTNAYISSFRIGDGPAADGCERTDGVTAYSGDLGPSYPQGLFVCQDNNNRAPAPGRQNFKFTQLEDVLPD